ncbi:MAG: xanthine dehydrogenase family protein molybdopterin-binding subunit [Chloroflexi bacterium]|jgi:4-hydroxybenzoyl-CoA reductase alpha subunit|nr:xanthine dehydrogenase family protein molybdopterin-binding subunit [Chloroflexota bacterium]
MAVAPKPHTIIGHRVPRIDAGEKVTGAARYVADIKRPGMLVGRILRSPLPHARIVRIDTSRAQRVPGVRAVITAADAPAVRWGAWTKDQYPLATGKVRYVGEEIAAVAAVDEATAEEALALIEVEYEELPAVFDPLEAMQPGAPVIHDERPDNIALVIDVERGDVEAAFARSYLIVEETFQSALQWPAPIETIGTVAEPHPDGRLTLYTNTQTPFMARDRIAPAIGVRPQDLRIIQTYVGGGFGGKSNDDNNAIVAGLLARRTGRPVRIINTREEDFLAGPRPRVPMRIRVKIGLSREGDLLAKHLYTIADNGAYSAKAGAVTGVAALRHDTTLKWQNVKSQALLVYTNKAPTGAFRGFGNPSASWAVEQALDIAAERLGIDPLDLLRKNACTPGYVSPHGNRVTSCELIQCIDRAAELSGYREKRARRRPFIGIGVSASAHVSGKRHFGDWDGSLAQVKIDESGQVTVLTGEGEIGQGASTLFAQLAAETLGVPLEDVRVAQADTDTTLFAQGAYASRLAYVAGNAIVRAAADARDKLLALAADELEASAGDLEIQNGKIFVRGAPDSRSTTVAEVAKKALFRRGGTMIVGRGEFDSDTESHDPKERYGNESGAYNFGCHIAEVAVDPDTGQVRLLSYTTVSDCGTVLNPIGAEGQVEGAIAQGIGYTLSEGFVIDEGKILNPNFSDYRLPTCADMPPLQRAFADSYEPTGPFGAKGLGELGMDPVAPAIGNAIADACGVRIHDLPITAEKVWRALRARAEHPTETTVSHDAPPTEPSS